MRENAREIAQRIKGLREDMEISATEMAGHLRVDPEQYARYESAAEDIPASELSEIATRLNVDLGLFLTGETPKMSLYAVTRAGTGPGVDRRKGYKYENLAAPFKGAKFEPFVVSLPKAAVDAEVPQNVHPGQEFNYMLQGRMLLKVQDNEFELGPGDSVIFDASKPHGMKAVSDSVKFLAIITV